MVEKTCSNWKHILCQTLPNESSVGCYAVSSLYTPLSAIASSGPSIFHRLLCLEKWKRFVLSSSAAKAWEYSVCRQTINHEVEKALQWSKQVWQDPEPECNAVSFLNKSVDVKGKIPNPTEDKYESVCTQFAVRRLSKSGSSVVGWSGISNSLRQQDIKYNIPSESEKKRNKPEWPSIQCMRKAPSMNNSCNFIRENKDEKYDKWSSPWKDIVDCHPQWSCSFVFWGETLKIDFKGETWSPTICTNDKELNNSSQFLAHSFCVSVWIFHHPHLRYHETYGS